MVINDACVGQQVEEYKSKSLKLNFFMMRISCVGLGLRLCNFFVFNDTKLCGMSLDREFN